MSGSAYCLVRRFFIGPLTYFLDIRMRLKIIIFVNSYQLLYPVGWYIDCSI